MVRIVALVLFLGALAAPITAFASEHLPRGTYGDSQRWYFDAAKAGDARTQFLLGLKYETGTDVARDLTKAADWYEKAARQEIPEAQFKLATLLESGQGRAADPAKAAQWYERAAVGGYAPAQYNLAVLQLNAASADAARIDGLVWLIKARDQGIESAANFLARIEVQWPAEIITEAKRRVVSDVPATRHPGNKFKD